MPNPPPPTARPAPLSADTRALRAVVEVSKAGWPKVEAQAKRKPQPGRRKGK